LATITKINTKFSKLFLKKCVYLYEGLRMKDDPHVQLMLRFQRGEESAFQEIFEAYKTPIINFIYRFCQDYRVAEELSQEVFLRIFKSASSYKPEAMFSTFIYRIATNICLNEIRTGKYKYELNLQNVASRVDIKEPEAVDKTTETKTDDNIVQNERHQAIRDAIIKLPEKQRIVLLFSVYDQLSYKEIGERLGCSEGAVKSIIHRAKIFIREILNKEIDF
jgi:RNA polymerase sigma-70 factor (ECF subfamily)